MNVIFLPIKMKIKKDQYKETIFDGNKTMKLVLPCKIESENNDNILQEFIAYTRYMNKFLRTTLKREG